MEPIEGSETSAFKTPPPGNYPKENIIHKEPGESLKSRNIQGRFPMQKVLVNVGVVSFALFITQFFDTLGHFLL